MVRDDARLHRLLVDVRGDELGTELHAAEDGSAEVGVLAGGGYVLVVLDVL